MTRDDSDATSVTVEFDADTLARIDRLADDRRTDREAVVRDLLDDWLDG